MWNNNTKGYSCNIVVTFGFALIWEKIASLQKRGGKTISSSLNKVHKENTNASIIERSEWPKNILIFVDYSRLVLTSLVSINWSVIQNEGVILKVL